MQNSEDIINWPFSNLTSPPPSPAKSNTATKAVQFNTPYQPHNGYAQDKTRLQIRTLLVKWLLALAVVLFLDALAITMYILVGLREHHATWFLFACVVVAAGLTAFGMLGVGGTWMAYRQAGRIERVEVGGEEGRELKALGRKDVFGSFSRAGKVENDDRGGEDEMREGEDVAREKLVQEEDEERHLTSPITVLHRPETSHSTSSHAISNTLNALSGHKINPYHLLSPHNHATQQGWVCQCPTCTPPPRFPSPVKLSERMARRNVSEDDPFYEVTRDSPVSPLTDREAAKVRRSDSLKKLKEATLKRKQAIEPLR